eukprot:4686597-Karenia_brevis.AAC.1
MVRPTAATLPNGTRWGGFDLNTFDIAGLARSVQRKYVHRCSYRYCLEENRNECRFFFPRPRQPQQ